MLIWPIFFIAAFTIVWQFFMPYWRDWRSKTKKPPQVSLRHLFLLVAIVAILAGSLRALDQAQARRIQEIQSRHDQAVRASKAKRDEALKQIEHARIQAHRDLLQSSRDELSPEQYDKRSRELDEEAAKLDVPSTPDPT